MDQLIITPAGMSNKPDVQNKWEENNNKNNIVPAYYNVAAALPCSFTGQYPRVLGAAASTAKHDPQKELTRDTVEHAVLL